MNQDELVMTHKTSPQGDKDVQLSFWINVLITKKQERKIFDIMNH